MLVLLALGGCASTDDNSDALTKITRHQASDMEQLCHVGKQPAKRLMTDYFAGMGVKTVRKAVKTVIKNNPGFAESYIVN